MVQVLDSKTFSESGSLKTHLTIIQEKSHLLVKNVPNNFLGRSHSPVLCSLFHKRKSVVPFKDSKNSNLVSTFSLLHHFWHCPLLSSNMSLSMFWLSKRSLTTILQRIFEMRKEKLLSCQSHFQIVLFPTIVMTKLKIPCQHYFQWLLFIDILEKIIMKLLIK